MNHADTLTAQLAYPVFLPQLEDEFGVCQGMMLGYNDEHKSSGDKWRWCAAVLPGTHMQHYLTRRSRQGKKGPFLIILGSTLDALKRAGVPRAFYGVGLLANMNQNACDILHPDQLNDIQNLNSAGKFKWPTGAPLLRVWQPPVPIPFSSLLSRHVSFNQGHGANLFDINHPVIKGIRPALATIGLREATMLRPQPIPPSILRLLRQAKAPETMAKPLHKEPGDPLAADESKSTFSSISPQSPLPKVVTQDPRTPQSPEVIPIPLPTLIMIKRLPPEQQEAAFQKLEADRINGIREVEAGLGGRCDILTDTEVVEVKRYSDWRHALGQILSYGHYFPGRSLRIYLFASPPEPEFEISVICGTYRVDVSYAEPFVAHSENM